MAFVAALLLWPAAALGQTPSTCALFGTERALELDWAASQTPVPIIDAVLADRLRACFGKGPSEPILRGDLQRLRALRHQGDHLDAITRLAGLELAVNLEELVLPDNQIADLRPLAGLTALTTLDLSRNQVADAVPLAASAWRGPDTAVNLAGNPLGRVSLNEALPRLAAHGIALDFDRPSVLLFPNYGAGLLRIINHSARDGEVEIAGYVNNPVDSERIEFALASGAAVNFDTGDLTAGNPLKGMAGGFSDVPFRMEFQTDLDIEVLVYARGDDGLLAALHDAAPLRGGLPQFDTVMSPNADHLSAMVLAGLALEDWVALSLLAHDDSGASHDVHEVWVQGGWPFWFYEARLEEMGLGGGSWRIETFRGRSNRTVVKGWSLLQGDDFLSNLSTRPRRLEAPLLPKAQDPLREGFARVANHSHVAGTVRIFAVDDAGHAREPVELALAARQTRHFNSGDLEAGGAEKGLSSGVGAGTGDWRLRFESDLDIRALTYVRHADDGFVTSMHDVAPSGLGRHRVATFGSASPFGSRSLLRIVNVGTAPAEVAVSGIDDLGRAGAGVVRLVVAAGAATTLTAAQLEEGGQGLTGRLGDGSGMWRLSVESAEPLRVMSLMEGTAGRLTNISTAMRGPRVDVDLDGVPDYADVDDDNDGIADARDALPHDPAESVDTDGDGVGNLADDDDDGDGVEDAFDARPLDASGHEPPNVADIRHYRFVGEHWSDRAFESMAVADVDCDGARDVVIGAPAHVGDEHHNHRNEPGAVYLVSAADLPAADAADGRADGIVYLGRVAAEPRSWKLVGDTPRGASAGEAPQYLGSSVASVGDMNGDGCADLLLGARAHNRFAGSAYLVSALDLPVADGADPGGVDGVVYIGRLRGQPGFYEFLGEGAEDNAGVAVAGMPDRDGDGFAELVVGASWHFGTDGTGEAGDRGGAAYLVARGDLAVLDAADGSVDGSIELASIGPGLRSLRLVGAPGDGLGHFLAVGEFDGDGRPDLAIGGVPGVLHLLAAADIPLLDAADGDEDGTVDLGGAVLGDASWQLSGPADNGAGRTWRMGDLSTGDIDGDGIDALVMSGWPGEHDRYPLDDPAGSSYATYVIPASTLDAADLADGVDDRAVRLELAAKQEGSLVFLPDDRDFRQYGFKSTVADIDGDGLDDVIFADGEAERGVWCQEPRWHGAAWLASGSYLSGLGAKESPIVLAELEPDGVGLWKFAGAGGERLGYGKPLAVNLDGDGVFDLIVGSYGPVKYDRGCWGRVAPGTAVAISAGVLGDADALDASMDGVIRFDSLMGDYAVLVDDALQIATTQFNENLVLMELSGEMNALLRHGLFPDDLAEKLYEAYEDAFDYLIHQVNLPSLAKRVGGWYRYVHNSTEGIGTLMLDDRQAYGSAGKLVGVVRVNDNDLQSLYLTLSHEIMHTWANFVIPPSPPGIGAHWGLSSANGVLGGFDRSKLVSLGDDRYAAGSMHVIAKPYSPIELYLAGWLPAAEVPSTWVARDGRWTGEIDDEHGPIFAASHIEEWPVERIIEEHGRRTPTVADSQKAFRAAYALVTDRENPAEQELLEELSALVRGYSIPTPDEDDETFNFYETTGGRATFATGDLSRFRKPGAAVSLARSTRSPDIRTFSASRNLRRFGGAGKPDLHQFCGVEHVGHGPAAESARFGGTGGPPRLAGPADSPGPYASANVADHRVSPQARTPSGE